MPMQIAKHAGIEPEALSRRATERNDLNRPSHTGPGKLARPFIPAQIDTMALNMKAPTSARSAARQSRSIGAVPLPTVPLRVVPFQVQLRQHPSA